MRRVHTLGLPTTEVLGTTFRGADLEAQLAVTTRRMAAALPAGTLTAARESVTAATVNILHSYRRHCATASNPGQLILPEALKLLPLYTLALEKSQCLRCGLKMLLGTSILLNPCTGGCHCRVEDRILSRAFKIMNSHFALTPRHGEQPHHSHCRQSQSSRLCVQQVGDTARCEGRSAVPPGVAANTGDSAAPACAAHRAPPINDGRHSRFGARPMQQGFTLPLQ